MRVPVGVGGDAGEERPDEPALARSLADAELDAVDDRGFELALGLFLDGLIDRGPAS